MEMRIVKRGVRDDEKQRMNFCPKWKKNENMFHNFDDIYSNDLLTVQMVVSDIKKFWDSENGKNEML